MQAEPVVYCEHRCLKDEDHIERGEPHFYGYLHIPESEKRQKEPEIGVSVDAVCDSCGSERAPKGRFPNYVCSDCGESQGKVCDSQPNWLVQY
jgi:predicted RNA-binding Zn-ribbon protein involved in translation (DUF1610 family)